MKGFKEGDGADTANAVEEFLKQTRAVVIPIIDAGRILGILKSRHGPSFSNHRKELITMFDKVTPDDFHEKGSFSNGSKEVVALSLSWADVDLIGAVVKSFAENALRKAAAAAPAPPLRPSAKKGFFFIKEFICRPFLDLETDYCRAGGTTNGRLRRDIEQIMDVA